MASNSDDPSFVVKMLEEFRSGSATQRRVSSTDSRSNTTYSGMLESLKRKSVKMEPDPNDSVKFRKVDVTPKTSPVDRLDSSKGCAAPTASPWETHRVRSQLIEANIKISDLENQISRHHSLRQEMESLFKRERESLQKQVDSERAMINELENHLQLIRRREVEVKEELKQCKSALTKDKINFEERIQNLQAENAKLSDSLQELELTTQNERLVTERDMQRLRDELTEKDEQLMEMEKRNSELESRVKEGLLFQNEFELLSQELMDAQTKIKELEKERDDHLEAAELVKKQQEKVFHYSELEKEVLALKEQNNNLKQAIPRHLLLEEMVEDLKSRQASSEENTQELAWAQGQLTHLQTVLDEWYKVAKDYCEGYMSASHVPDPAIIKKRINDLQQRVHILTAELSEVKSQFNDTKQKKDVLAIELSGAKKEVVKVQGMNDQLSSRMRLLQRKLQLITTERDSYRSQLDSYEKDLTISSSTVSNLQIQQLQQKLENSERILDGYRKMLEKMESETDRSKGSVGNAELLEKLSRLENEKIILLQEKEALQKRKDDLEVQLEYRAIKGDFNPITSKVFHLRMNPRAEAEARYEDEVTTLRSKCTRLEERIKLLEEGNIQDITQKVEDNVTSSNTQELQELKEVISAQEIKMQRLKEVFHASAKEFREVCYELFGYQIDRNENIYKLSSMYADSPDDILMFKRLSDGSIDMMETSFSAVFTDLINLHLLHHKSLPLFLGAVTVELFNRQTLSQTVSESMELTSVV